MLRKSSTLRVERDAGVAPTEPSRRGSGRPLGLTRKRPRLHFNSNFTSVVSPPRTSINFSFGSFPWIDGPGFGRVVMAYFPGGTLLNVIVPSGPTLPLPP